jgi:hypothetical protein
MVTIKKQKNIKSRKNLTQKWYTGIVPLTPNKRFVKQSHTGKE